MGVQIQHAKEQFRGRTVHCKYIDFLPWAAQELLKGRFAVWIVDLGWPKEAQVQSYSPGGANCAQMGRHIGTTGEYDWAVRLRQRCGLMSNYFDHWLSHKLTRARIQCDALDAYRIHRSFAKTTIYRRAIKLEINLSLWFCYCVTDWWRCTAVLCWLRSACCPLW